MKNADVVKKILPLRRLYCERSQSLKNAKEAPCNLSQAKPAPGPQKNAAFFLGQAVEAKLKKFSDAGGSQIQWLPDERQIHTL